MILTKIFEVLFAKSVSELWEHRNNVWLYLKTLGPYRNKPIRFSLSYLFRIRIPETDLYLLVLNRKIKNQLQPVGGVYKRYGDHHLFEKWGIQADSHENGLGTDKQSKADLRFRVKGKHVIEVIKWFKEGREREISAEREFIEELIDTNILDQKTFRKIKYKHLRRVSKNLAYSQHHQCHEILIYDVMELIPNKKQRKALVEISKKGTRMDMGYAIATQRAISQLRYCEGDIQIAKIGEHTKLIINQKI